MKNLRGKGSFWQAVAAAFIVWAVVAVWADGAHSATSCTAVFSQDGVLNVPVVAFGDARLSLDMRYSGSDGCSFWFYPTRAQTIADPSAFSGCEPSTLGPGFGLHLPEVGIGGGIMSVDFQYIADPGGMIRFRLTGLSPVAAISAGAYTVAQGQTVDLTGSLIVHASDTAAISGTIAPSAHAGQSVTIIADRDVTISGAVIAGNGFAGGPGGTVTIISRNGNITFTDTAQVTAGDGGSGTACTSSSGFVTSLGGNGGSVILKAPNGTITAADKPGLFHIGNGGNSGEVRVQGEALLTAATPVPGAMKPGNSGLFDMSAATINGIPYQAAVMDRDIVDPSTGMPIYTTGTPINMPLSTRQFSGGMGGEAGALFYGMDGNGNSTWPQLAAMGIHPSAGHFGLSIDALPDEYPNLHVSGADGGVGYFSSGNGASASARGRDGSVPGQGGQSAVVIGGIGSDCVFWGCTQGRGGKAVATGGNGAAGSDPSGTGGSGGYAIALGGAAPTAQLMGEAVATGGHGGKGGGTCPDHVAATGGYGGSGGAADASSNSPLSNVKGRATARGGDGGQGGDGIDAGGPGGAQGNAVVLGNSQSRATNGSSGNDGSTCPPSPPPPENTCRCGDPGVTLTVVSGCQGWDDATQCSGWASVAHENGQDPNGTFNDGTTFTAFGCTIRINCP